VSARIEVIRYDHAAAIDHAWPAKRPAGAPEHLWRWAQIRYSCVQMCGGEAWAVLGDDQTPIAAWATSTPLTKHNLYVLDYFEVAPDVRRRGIGAAAFREAICPRARHLGADGVVLGAFPESEAFYARLGLLPCPSKLWRAERGAVSLWWNLR
jgi:GNAT superfamily N-acetyltransferase